MRVLRDRRSINKRK